MKAYTSPTSSSPDFLNFGCLNLPGSAKSDPGFECRLTEIVIRNGVSAASLPQSIHFVVGVSHFDEWPVNIMRNATKYPKMPYSAIHDMQHLGLHGSSRKDRYILATKSKGRSTFGRQKSPSFDNVFNCGDNVDGDKSATKSKVDNFVDFRLCRQCVPAVTCTTPCV